ncbi:MAG: ribonuclease HII [Candidatus Thermoplasmatota archaeon]|nr:ribonuclease HII [Candidatus Thermoplasmatota archaeon]
MVIGIDEAGRGPVLGPLVVAAIRIDPKDLDLDELKITDSKLMTPRNREKAFEVLKKRSDHCIIEVTASAVDDARSRMTMNQLEIYAFSTALASLVSGSELVHPELQRIIHVSLVPSSRRARRIILDAADVNAERFGRLVREEVSKLTCIDDLEIISEHKADLNHLVVGAASVLAKVTRDRKIEKFRMGYGADIGSGYPGDPRTIEFLGSYIRENGRVPDIARSSWKTSKRLMAQYGQSSLSDF